MPSGAKKRKAAKKKKEKEAAHHHHHHPHFVDVHSHGDDDLKHHDDDKESDAEEVGSPASQEYPNNHHQFPDREKEEVEKTEDRTDVQSSSKEKKSFGETKEDNEATQMEMVEERDIEIEQELKPADVETESKADSDELNSKTEVVENVESQKEDKDEVLLQSMKERSLVQIDTDSKPGSDEFNKKNAIMENVEPVNDGAVHSLDQGNVTQIGAVLKTINELENKNDTFQPTKPLKEFAAGDFQSQNEESHVIDKNIVVVDNSQFVNPTQAFNYLSQGLTQVINGSEVGNHRSSSVETKAAGGMEKIKLSDEKSNGNTSVLADRNGGMKENGEKEVILPERNGRIPPTCVDLGTDNRGDEAIVKTKNIEAAPDARISASHDIGEKLTVSRNVPETETAKAADSSHSTNYIEHLKDSEVPRSSDSQPSVPSASRVVQKTSWMNCCGLLEVFAGSNR